MRPPPFALRRTLLIWLPLFAVGAISFTQAPTNWAVWLLIPITCVLCAILAEFTDTKEVST